MITLLTDWDSPNAIVKESCHGYRNGSVTYAVWCRLEAKFINRKCADTPKVQVVTRPRDKWIALELLGA